MTIKQPIWIICCICFAAAVGDEPDADDFSAGGASSSPVRAADQRVVNPADVTGMLIPGPRIV